MFDVGFLAIALSMDAFAVSIGLGAKKVHNTISLAIRAGVYFGIFQAIMPLIGHFAGIGLVQYVEQVDHWIAFGLLALIGGKMIYESIKGDVSEDISALTNRIMLVLAIATSIDALAAGYSLSLLNVDPFVAMFLIGLTTFCFSFIGVFIGVRTGTRLESKAELVGGLVLIAIGIKILMEHTLS